MKKTKPLTQSLIETYGTTKASMLINSMLIVCKSFPDEHLRSVFVLFLVRLNSTRRHVETSILISEQIEKYFDGSFEVHQLANSIIEKIDNEIKRHGLTPCLSLAATETTNTKITISSNSPLQ